MKRNNSDSQKKTLKKQLISGGVYIALSAVAVAVTVNTAVSLLSNSSDIPEIGDIPNNISYEAPPLPQYFIAPSPVPEQNSNIADSPSQDITVSDTPLGITAEITESVTPSPEESAITPHPSEPSLDIDEISSNTNLGEDIFINPCGGFVTVEHSTDIPVYSPTFSDYRTHNGIDIAADKNTPVKAVKGGVVTKMYTNDLYGSSLSLETPDGYTFVYSNLSPNYADGITEGMAISVGTVIGSIGESAICEASQESHLHLEVYRDGCAIDPQEVISF